jgi:hypothetical protein
LAIDVESLRSERERLKEALRELETEQRRLDGELKTLRQREIQTKRTIEALTTLLELHDVPPQPQPPKPATEVA